MSVQKSNCPRAHQPEPRSRPPYWLPLYPRSSYWLPPVRRAPDWSPCPDPRWLRARSPTTPLPQPPAKFKFYKFNYHPAELFEFMLFSKIQQYLVPSPLAGVLLQISIFPNHPIRGIVSLLLPKGNPSPSLRCSHIVSSPP